MIHVLHAAKNVAPQKFSAVFSALASNFKAKFYTYLVFIYAHIISNIILHYLIIISIAVLPPSDFSTFKNVQTNTVFNYAIQTTATKRQRILQSLRMFKVSNLSFNTSLQSLWKLLYSFVDHSRYRLSEII